MKLVGLSLALIVFLSIQAYGQMAECSGITRGGYKVLLDDIVIAQSAGNTSNDIIVMDRLQNSLRTNLRKLDTDAPSRISVVRCVKRKPRDGTDFVPDLVSRLNQNGVLLEVWGNTESRMDPSGQTRHAAYMYYALVPLLADQARNRILDGVRRIEYTAKLGPAETFDVFEQASEIRPFILLNLGIKLLVTNKYNLAKECFCKAEGLLSEGGAVQAKSPHNDILRYVQDLSMETVERAKNDRNYSGALRLVPSGSAMCREGN